jgi:hypothetical protein
MLLMTRFNDEVHHSHVGHYHWSQYRNPAWRWVHPTNPPSQPGLTEPKIDLAKTTSLRYNYRVTFLTGAPLNSLRTNTFTISVKF